MENGEFEELKLIAEDRRFYVTRYMHAGAFYLAMLALGIKLIVEATTTTALIAFLCTFQLVNALAFFLAYRFRIIVYDRLERERFLSLQLGFKEPAELLWGYWAAVFIAAISVIAFTVLAWTHYLTLSG